MQDRPPLRDAGFLLLLTVVFMLFWGLAGTIGSAATPPSKVRVGSELDFPPYAFADENGRPAGFSIDLVQAVTYAMGIPIEISTGSWDAVWSSLVAGRLDLLPIVAKLPERIRLVDFSLPHTETYDSFFVREGTPSIPNIEAARGKEIVVMRSDAAHHALLERNFHDHLILVNTIPEGLSLIASGKHDAFLCSKLIGTLAIRKHGLEGLITGPPLAEYKRVFSFAVKKGDTELLEKLNQGLMIIKTNGVYDRIYAKWLTVDDPWFKWKKYFTPAVAVIGAISLILGFWLMMLQILVKKRTHDLAQSNEMLRLAREGLEEEVSQRTSELAQANASLYFEIIERRQVENELRDARDELESRVRDRTKELTRTVARLEQLNQELQEFAFVASHDLQEPLRKIQTFCDLAKKRSASVLDDDSLEYLDRVINSAGRMRHLLRDLLLFSRIAVRPESFSKVDLAYAVREAAHLFRTSFQETGCKVEIGNLPVIEADESQMIRLFQTLIDNALKYGGREIPYITINGTSDGQGGFEILIKDNGMGFEPEYAELVFKPFERLHGRGKYDGTGMGLAVCRKIVERHGGSIRAESEPGRGTTFFIRLPGRQINLEDDRDDRERS